MRISFQRILLYRPMHRRTSWNMTNILVVDGSVQTVFIVALPHKTTQIHLHLKEKKVVSKESVGKLPIYCTEFVGFSSNAIEWSFFPTKSMPSFRYDAGWGHAARKDFKKDTGFENSDGKCNATCSPFAMRVVCSRLGEFRCQLAWFLLIKWENG